MEYGELIFYDVTSVESDPDYSFIGKPEIDAEVTKYIQANLVVQFTILYYQSSVYDGFKAMLLSFQATEFEWKKQPDQSGYY